jgi:hypothetical protein
MTDPASVGSGSEPEVAGACFAETVGLLELLGDLGFAEGEGGHGFVGVSEKAFDTTTGGAVGGVGEIERTRHVEAGDLFAVDEAGRLFQPCLELVCRLDPAHDAAAPAIWTQASRRSAKIVRTGSAGSIDFEMFALTSWLWQY